MGHTAHPLGWPSVTQALNVIAKPFLYRWYARHGWDKCELIKKESSELGQRVHEGIETLLKGNSPLPSNLSERELSMVNLFDQWRKESGFKPVELERKVEHKALKYHGTFDGIGTFGDKPELWIMDWKTTSQIDDSYGIQLSAYAEAYQAETGKEVVAGGIVRLSKDPLAYPQIEVKQFDKLHEVYFPVFKACLDIWNFQKSSTPKKRKK